MTETMRPMLRVLLAIEAYRSAAATAPDQYDRHGPTARGVDRFLGVEAGTTRRLVQSVRDRDYVMTRPPRRGSAGRLSLTETGRAYLLDGCPLRTGRRSTVAA